MKRWIVLCLVAWVGNAQAQLALPSMSERLVIEMIPVMVLTPDTLTSLFDVNGNVSDDEAKRFYDDVAPKFTEMFVSTRRALYTLGVDPTEYDLRLGEIMQFLICDEATVLSEQTCLHFELGPILDLGNFVYDLYDQKLPPMGIVHLHILLLESEVAWSGKLGVAWRAWRRGEEAIHHWSNTRCLAWALRSVSVIAHELGHCFRLKHNEDDTDYGLDLMKTTYTHFDWVKPSNLAIVRHHFRTPIPLSAVPTEPMEIELHY